MLFVDGTFSVRPHHNIFAQIINILVEINGLVIPVAHALLTNKDEGLYDAMWDKFKSLIPGFSPVNCMSDFEKGLLNSMKAAFPNARVTGCRFHFGQAGTIVLLIQLTPDNVKNGN